MKSPVIIPKTMHLHLDTVGGIAGDMFIAAMLDAFPEFSTSVFDAIEKVIDRSQVECQLDSAMSNALAGKQFTVRKIDTGHSHGHSDHSHSHHSHGLSYKQIRTLLKKSSITNGVRVRANAIFKLLATAEANVHGVAIDDVHFHEVGDWDSVADIVGASVIIDKLGDVSWSVSALPIGRGQVNTQHGPLPVPAPATTQLLQGFRMIDDGFGGERITPTGAAILRHLAPQQQALAVGQERTLAGEGTGIGSRRVKGLNNILRVMLFRCLEEQPEQDSIALLTFNIDDQSPEDLAIGLDNIRDLQGVVDVVQIAAIGKKGRATSQIQVMVSPSSLEATVAACFAETTTIGIREQVIRRHILQRESQTIAANDRQVSIKRASRGTTVTTKIESDELREIQGGYRARQRLRTVAEADEHE